MKREVAFGLFVATILLVSLGTSVASANQGTLADHGPTGPKDVDVTIKVVSQREDGKPMRGVYVWIGWNKALSNGTVIGRGSAGFTDSDGICRLHLEGVVDIRVVEVRPPYPYQKKVIPVTWGGESSLSIMVQVDWPLGLYILEANLKPVRWTYVGFYVEVFGRLLQRIDGVVKVDIGSQHTQASCRIRGIGSVKREFAVKVPIDLSDFPYGYTIYGWDSKGNYYDEDAIIDKLGKGELKDAKIIIEIPFKVNKIVFEQENVTYDPDNSVKCARGGVTLYFDEKGTLSIDRWPLYTDVLFCVYRQAFIVTSFPLKKVIATIEAKLPNIKEKTTQVSTRQGSHDFTKILLKNLIEKIEKVLDSMNRKVERSIQEIRKETAHRYHTHVH
ncbi:MAG TPA: hypothetical protein ENG60_03950 [Thermoplasmatales archaeon]|nr:hypothetical protein [Thermoplasmatales archaeon]HEX17542.1 hypothetical protein [Thermoplasmatales archaeon]